MRGRKPKPTALRVLQGNPGKRALNHDEPTFPEIGECPAILDGEARQEWDRITVLFDAARIITAADRAALTLYCQSWSRWNKAENELKKTNLIVKAPSGYPMQNPWLSIANKAFEQLKAMAAEFGMTASSRSRVKSIPKKTVSGVKRLLG